MGEWVTCFRRFAGSPVRRFAVLLTRPFAVSHPTGAVLLGALIILLTISLIGATLASFFFSVTTVAEVELARSQALYLAEGGIARAIHQIQQAGSMGGEAQQRIAATQLGAGEYEASHDLVAGLITSTGKVRGVRRTIQLKYYPF